VGVLGVGELVDVGDAKLQFAVFHHLKDRAGTIAQFLSGRDVMPERGPGDVERAFGRELDEIEGRNGAAGASKEDHVTARAEDVEAFFESGLTDAVVNDVNALVVGEALSFGFEIVAGIEDDFVSASMSGNPGFFLGGNGGNDASASVVSHLNQQRADSAGGGVDERGLSSAEGESIVDQIVGGHALQDRGGGLLIGDAVGNWHQAVGGSSGVLGVGAEDAGPGNVIARLYGSDSGADGGNHAGSFLAEDEWQRNFVASLALIGVDEIDAAGGDFDDGLVGLGLGDRKIDELEYFGSAGLGYLNGFHDGLDYRKPVRFSVLGFGIRGAVVTFRADSKVTWAIPIAD
jgi:hypothetical protein